VHEGQGIRVTGEGEPGKLGGPRGDLYCYVRIKEHPFMVRDGANLVVTVPLSFTQMTLGAMIDVPTLAVVGGDSEKTDGKTRRIIERVRQN
jgi:molecular chaperone DnaJ